jgi:hypothetical protein
MEATGVKEDQLKLIKEIRNAEVEQSEKWVHYWKEYSNFSTWDF